MHRCEGSMVPAQVCANCNLMGIRLFSKFMNMQLVSVQRRRKDTHPDKWFINTLRVTYCRMKILPWQEYIRLRVYRSYYWLLSEIIHSDRRCGSTLAIAWTWTTPDEYANAAMWGVYIKWRQDRHHWDKELAKKSTSLLSLAVTN